jgi:hypothetical protein
MLPRWWRHKFIIYVRAESICILKPYDVQVQYRDCKKSIEPLLQYRVSVRVVHRSSRKWRGSPITQLDKVPHGLDAGVYSTLSRYI